MSKKTSLPSEPPVRCIRLVRCERPKLKMDVWQNSRPGNKFPVVCQLKNRRWHIVRVGHAWAHWQSAAKEGRQLMAQASNAALSEAAGKETSK